jgi:hypothetical protein
MHDQRRPHLDVRFASHSVGLLLLDSTDLGFDVGPCCKPFHPHRIRLLGVLHSRFVLGAKEVNDFLEFGCLHEKNAHIQTV